MTLPAELAAYLEKHPETRFVDAVLYDLCGTAIGKRVPVRDVGKLWSGGVAFCAGITTLDALGACWDVNGIGFSDGDPDATSYPLPGTLVPVPWAEVPTAQVQIAPAQPADAPHWWFDPRAILASVVARFAELGLKPVVANELEFYFVDPKRDEKGRISPALPARCQPHPRPAMQAKRPTPRCRCGFGSAGRIDPDGRIFRAALPRRLCCDQAVGIRGFHGRSPAARIRLVSLRTRDKLSSGPSPRPGLWFGHGGR